MYVKIAAIFAAMYKQNLLYWTSDIIFSLASHLQSLHISFVLQTRHYTYFLSLFADWETYGKLKSLNMLS